MLTNQLLTHLQGRLAATALGEQMTGLSPLPDTGLAHDHVAIDNTPWLLRIPKQSQLALAPEANLHYQTTCFLRAAPSGHTPAFWGALEPDPALPLGALIVERIPGQVLQLPAGLAPLAQALAALHRLPPPRQRAPLKEPPQPLLEMLDEIRAQAEFLPQARLEPASRALIEDELRAAAAEARGLTQQGLPAEAVTLISFDAHPGNFLLDQRTAAPHAVLVDLEKARYSLPGFDLAHATLYTSTTWDIASYALLSPRQVVDFYRAWLAAVPPALAVAQRPLLLPTRRLMWLWSVTWCAKWRVQSQPTEPPPQPTTENWSADLSAAALIRHVSGRVDDYLSLASLSAVRAEGRAIAPLLAAAGPV